MLGSCHSGLVDVFLCRLRPLRSRLVVDRRPIAVLLSALHEPPSISALLLA